MMSTENKRRSRRRGDRKVAHAAPAKNYRQLKHAFKPQEIFTADRVAAIHEMALKVLQELGMKVLLPEARRLFSEAGAKVEDDMVFIGREIVEAALQTAPNKINMRSINPLREQLYANGSMLFKAGAGCPNATDLVRGRRPGDLESYVETIKLVQSFDVLHTFGPAVEPQDVPLHERHYAMMDTQMRYGDKPLFVYARGRAQVEQSFDMIRQGWNIADDEFANGVWASTVINTNSPRTLDNPMAQGIIDFARHGQMTIITPFCLAGAMAPISVAGALTLQHAEALCGITLAQLAKSGAPVSYGGFSSNVDMKSGSPAFGTPAHVQMQIGAGQLARYIDLPWRSATGAAANCADMQAANETNMALWGAAISNATLTVHAAGWLEGGLSFGYEKFINDLEALQTMAELTLTVNADDAELAWDSMYEVDPGGHFFATQHTLARYENAFYEPLVADLQNYGSWVEAGSQSSAERATKIWQDTLSNFTPPSTGAYAHERLAGFIAKGKAAGGADVLN